jgi:alpha,alpha-trehalose phosphorylase
MYVPFDAATGIVPQDDSFLDRKAWDLKNTPRDRFPLLLYHHPLVIYRHQVIKQADVVLALFLLGQEFTAEEKRRNFDYYDPLTTGDSSLSACIQSIVANEIGDTVKALKYARYALLMDLADVGGNVKDGCHIASMGGTWMVIVYGFAGMRDFGGRLSFTPRLPRQLRRLGFSLRVGESVLAVDLDQAHATYTLREGGELTIVHQGEELHLTAAVALKRPVAGPSLP